MWTDASPLLLGPHISKVCFALIYYINQSFRDSSTKMCHFTHLCVIPNLYIILKSVGSQTNLVPVTATVWTITFLKYLWCFEMIFILGWTIFKKNNFKRPLPIFFSHFLPSCYTYMTDFYSSTNPVQSALFHKSKNSAQWLTMRKDNRTSKWVPITKSSILKPHKSFVLGKRQVTV